MEVRRVVGERQERLENGVGSKGKRGSRMPGTGDA